MTRASGPAGDVIAEACAGDSGRALSDAVDDFCRDELSRLEVAREALSSGRTETTIGEVFSVALVLRLETNFLFCVHTRRIPDDDARDLRLAFSTASDRYYRVRTELAAAGREMAAMIAAYRKLLSYPAK